jgi:putative transposase
VVSVAVIIATGNNSDGRREVSGLEIVTAEAEPIWTAFVGKLTRRGLQGVKLAVSDAHEGMKAAGSTVLCASWQRCRAHFTRDILAHAGKSGRSVADQIRPKVPKLAPIMDGAEPDVLIYMTFPKEHHAKLHSTNPSSVSTARSSGGQTPSASSITTMLSSASSAPSSSSRMMIGTSSAPVECHWELSTR